MKDLAEKTAKELRILLAAKGVTVSEKAKKPAVLKLAEKHLTEEDLPVDEVKVTEGETPFEGRKANEGGQAGQPDPTPEPPAQEVKLETAKGAKGLDAITMTDAGFKPTGRFEAVEISKSKEAWRVFGPEGQMVTPVLIGMARLSSDPKAQGEMLPASGRAYSIAGSQNMHLQRALGSKVFATKVANAIKQGFPR